MKWRNLIHIRYWNALEAEFYCDNARKILKSYNKIVLPFESKKKIDGIPVLDTNYLIFPKKGA